MRQVSFCSQLALLPGIVLAAQCCPVALEAFVFSLFSGTAHVASLQSAAASTALTLRLHIEKGDYSNLWLLILICSLCTFLPLLFLPFMSSVDVAPVATVVRMLAQSLRGS
jgi:hypothetical protein